MAELADFAALARRAASLATGPLGWRPGDFWEATPAELRTAIEGRWGKAAAPLGMDELAALRERLPDG